MTEENNTAPKGKVPRYGFAIPSTFKGYEDIGYNAAKFVNEGASVIFAALAERGEDFLAKDGLSQECKDGLMAGFMLRKVEISKPYWMRLEGLDNYSDRRDTPPPKGEKGWVRFDIQTALGYTTHEYGKLKEQQPNLKERIGALRKEASQYGSNTMKRLERMAKAMQEKASGGRAAAKTFSQTLDEFFGSLPKKSAAAATRGDTSAIDAAVLKRKIAAFKSAK